MRSRMQIGMRGLVAGALVASLAACGGDGNSDADGTGGAAGGDLKLGTFVEPTSFDPATAQEGNYIPYFQPVYDSLIKREPDGSLAPMLAESWEYNEDNTELTLELRDGVTFTDGTTFDSSVVQANIAHFREANGPQATTASAIESVDAPDGDTVVINLTQPDPSLTISLSNALGFMASPEAVGSESIAGEPVGSGPYTLDAGNTVVGSQYSYVRNPDYWGEELPYDTISFLVLPDETARLNALQSGQVNAAVFQQPSSSQQIEAAGLQLLGQTGDWVGFHFYDRTGQMLPALGDVRVRQALNYAIDKEAILEQVYLGRGEMTNQIFGPATGGYIEELDDDRFAYDPDRARELLAEAGQASGLTIDLPVSPAFDPAIYTTIEQQLGDVGVQVNRIEYGPGQSVPALTGGKHYLAYMQLFTPNDWTTIQQAIAPEATWNPLGTTDPVVTDLIEQIRVAADDSAREPLVEELNQYIVDQAWFAPFFRPSQTYGADQETQVELQVEQAVPSIYNYSPAS